MLKPSREKSSLGTSNAKTGLFSLCAPTIHIFPPGELQMETTEFSATTFLLLLHHLGVSFLSFAPGRSLPSAYPITSRNQSSHASHPDKIFFPLFLKETSALIFIPKCQHVRNKGTVISSDSKFKTKRAFG